MKSKSPWSIGDIFGIALLLLCWAPIIYIFGYSLVKNFWFWIGLALSIFVLGWIHEQDWSKDKKVGISFAYVVAVIACIYYFTNVWNAL